MSPFAPLALLALAAAGCAGGGEVHTWTDPTADLARRDTFAVEEPAAPSTRGAVRVPAALNGYVRQAVIDQLRAKGLRPVAAGDAPDVIATYAVIPRTGAAGQGAANAGDDVYRLGGYDEPGAVTPRRATPGDVDYRDPGAPRADIALELLDGRSRRPLWRASCDDAVAGAAPAKEVGRAVARAFQDFPARAKP